MNALTPMSPEDLNRFGIALMARVGEMLDGYAVVGFHPISREPITIKFNPDNDPRTTLALDALLMRAVSHPTLTPMANSGHEGS